jgi:hypothetical protein
MQMSMAYWDFFYLEQELQQMLQQKQVVME